MARVAAGVIRQRVVAQGRLAPGGRGDEPRLVQSSGLGVPDHQVRRVATLKETAGYDKYVRWCERTGDREAPLLLDLCKFG